MFMDIAKKNYQLFWALQQKNLDTMVQMQESVTETCVQLIKASIEKNLDALEDLSRKIQDYEDTYQMNQRASNKKNFPILSGLAHNFFTNTLKNLTFSRKSLLNLLRDQYFPRGFEMAKKITKTCSLSLMSLMSTVSGRGISSESVLDYTLTPMNGVEVVSLSNSQKSKNPSSAVTLRQTQTKEQEARLQENARMHAAFMKAKQELDSEKTVLQRHQKAKWDKAQERMVPNSAEWYGIQAERYAAFAEWYPNQAAQYKEWAAQAKTHQNSLLRDAEIQAKVKEWDRAQQAVSLYGAEWYEIEVEKYTTYLEWYPEDEYYQGQRQQATRNALEARWNEQEAAVDRESPEWYEIQIQRFTAFAEWYPDQADYYRGQAGRYREEMRTAPERAARARQEEAWRQREWGLAWRSAEWYDLQSEMATIHAEWYPERANDLLGYATTYREEAAALRANEALRAEAERREAERREAQAREEAARQEAQAREAEARAAVRARISADVEVDLTRARDVLATYGPAAAYEILKDRVTLFSGYHEPLERMQQERRVTPDEENDRSQGVAIKKALWHKLQGYMEAKAVINPDADDPDKKYLNIVKLLTETQAPDLVIGAGKIEDTAWEQLILDTRQLALDLGVNYIQQDHTDNWNGGPDLINNWMSKLMMCAQARDGDGSGRHLLRNRAKKIIEYLQKLKDEGTADSSRKAKNILETDILKKALACPDGVLSSLDDAETNIKLAESTTSEEALAVIIQKVKKHILERYVVDLGSGESVEEYLYLIIMFNEHLALGLPETEMLYTFCGANQTFDDALSKMLEHINYEAIINIIAADESWEKKLKTFFRDGEYEEAVRHTQEEAEREKTKAFEQLNADNEDAQEDVIKAFESAEKAAQERKDTALAPLQEFVQKMAAIEQANKAAITEARRKQGEALDALTDDDGDDVRQSIYDRCDAAISAANTRMDDALAPIARQVQEIKEINDKCRREIGEAVRLRDEALDPFEFEYINRGKEIMAAYEEAKLSTPKRLTKEIFDREFVVTGSKYAGITARHIAKIEDAIRADNTSPEQLLDRARARLAELEAPTAAERARLEAAIQEDRDAIDGIYSLEEAARRAEARLNELAIELMERNANWDMDIIQALPEFVAAQAAYEEANAQYQAASSQDTDALSERIRTNQNALLDLNVRTPEVIQLQQEIRDLEAEIRSAHG